MFEVDDLAVLAEFIERFPFATIIANGPSGMIASHVPLLLQVAEHKTGTLVGHLARKNPQWKTFRNSPDVLAIFHGPHGYISPAWYDAEVAVPTWNYAVVHAHGQASLIEDESRVSDVLDQTVHRFEDPRAEPWQDETPSDLRNRLLQAIVAFQIDVTCLTGTFKLGQNRSEKDIDGMVAGLRAEFTSATNPLANFIEERRSRS